MGHDMLQRKERPRCIRCGRDPSEEEAFISIGHGEFLCYECYCAMMLEYDESEEDE